MEALGAAASVIAIVEIVGRVSASAASFMRDIKDARKDMIQVRKDMSDLSTVLHMVAEDLDHQGDNSSYPRYGSSSLAGNTPPGQQHIVGIALRCRTILMEIEMVLRDGRSRLSWITSGKERVDRLRTRLETCKLSLDVALDYRTMVVVHDIKEDSTRIVGDLSTIQRDVALLLGKVDNIEQKASAGQEFAGEAGDSCGGVMLDRFLNDCRSDAQTVLDNIEYQQDEDFEDVRTQVRAEAPELAPEFKSESTPSSSSQKILFRNTLGHEHEIPLEQCRTWPDMEGIIKSSYSQGSLDFEEIKDGRYTLMQTGHVIRPKLPASWDKFVARPLSFSLVVFKYHPITFKDPLNLKWDIAWSLVRTWEGMETSIKQKYSHFISIGPLVRQGHYDLIGPDNTTIPPDKWEQCIKPGMSITMRTNSAFEQVRRARGKAEKNQARNMRRQGSSASKREPRPPTPGRGPGILSLW